MFWRKYEAVHSVLAEVIHSNIFIYPLVTIIMNAVRSDG
jgi:hypothetical protein